MRQPPSLEEDSGGGGSPSSCIKRKQRFSFRRLCKGLPTFEGYQVGVNWQVAAIQRKRRRNYSMEAKETQVKVTTAAQQANQWFEKLSSLAATLKTAILLLLLLASNLNSEAQVMMQSDPRPTIYSGQVSFGLLLSAHSPIGAELSTSASQQVISRISATESSTMVNLLTLASSMRPKVVEDMMVVTPLPDTQSPFDTSPPTRPSIRGERDEAELEEDLEAQVEESRPPRQIFENIGIRYRGNDRKKVAREQARSGGGQKQSSPDLCSQVNPNALYAGMGAIWASHQANLVGDSHLAIGTYVYDSCNDLDVGQRQSVRIVSNLNAFQQTTCESPRGSPISLTIAHGDNQSRAIQLLTSFKVPVITTREHFALDDYPELTHEQRSFLFTTAPSSRHLAQGAIRFARQIVSKSIASAKLANQFDKKSPRQGLIVISRNLPPRFIAYLDKEIPHYVNYEILHSTSPIDQIRSVEQVESILNSRSAPKVEESRQVTSRTILVPPQRLGKRNSDEDGDSSDSSSNSETGGQSDKMISPTILMFITPSEAIDLVTRLRNDLADVSRYFSLIVATREDLSPALKTIFHRGGSRLCSGKAFYTISPKPDDIGEFSRYFRDTVQMEGDSSDHPLICEFARYQAASRSFLDLDDISTEPVIKAVWSAAAAFKSVHRRECSAHLLQAGGSSTSSPSSSASTAPSTASTTTPPGGGKHQRQAKPASASSSAHQECMIRMNKNMSSLVQRALKKLDVSINSTGLQSLDGFRIKFDHRGELMTNKFGINYINKECEMTEIGYFTGHDRSHLVLDKESMDKSLEGSMPEPWPMPKLGSGSAAPTPVTTTTTTSSRSSSTSSPMATTASNNPESETNSPEVSTDKSRSLSSRKRQSPEPSSADEEEEPPSDTRSRKRSRDAPRRNVVAASNMKKTTTTTDLGTTKLGRKLKPFPSPEGTTVKEWLPSGNVADEKDKEKEEASKNKDALNSLGGSEKKETTTLPTSTDMTAETSTNLESRTTQAPHPVRSTLPESDGDTDLDSVVPFLTTTKSPQTRLKTLKRFQSPGASPETQVTAHSAQDYVTAPTTNSLYRSGLSSDKTISSVGDAHHTNGQQINNRTFDQLREFARSTTPEQNFGATLMGAAQQQASSDQQQQQQDLGNTQRARLRAHIKWIYSSWYALSILGANICGALMTLYVLTFLLMKNCDGHLDRENQGLRSMHLLAIIVVFFGSTLFIVYPTPGLCLLRSSWHNFALVLLFGSLLLDAMQTRSLNSLGLGGRPNRLNQFLTLLFIVGVQVAFELQRWKYESSNYLNFVQQYFGPSSSHQEDNRKLMILNNAISDQFNPLTSFNDQVTPVSIQVSEHYQNLLQDYCLQQADDFLQGQIYLCIIVLLLFLFSLSNRRRGLSSSSGRKLTTATLATTSGRLVASQHEANLTDVDLVVGGNGGCGGSPSAGSHFHFTPNSSAHLEQVAQGPNMFLVSTLATLAYTISVLLQVYGQNTAATNRDLISSVTMVFVAFLALVGIFLPILIRIHRFRRLGGLVVASEDSFGAGLAGDPRRPLPLPLSSSHHTTSAATSSSSLSLNQQGQDSSSKPFNMFPEFAPTGLRRPSSASGDTSASSGSRRLFAETKESRRNMGAALAQLGPSEDSLRSMGFYTGHRATPAAVTVPAQDDPQAQAQAQAQAQPQPQRRHQQVSSKRPRPNFQQTSSGKGSGGSEKRLIMLDVDPCCPRHGLGAWPTIDETSGNHQHHHHHPNHHQQAKSSLKRQL